VLLELLKDSFHNPPIKAKRISFTQIQQHNKNTTYTTTMKLICLIIIAMACLSTVAIAAETKNFISTVGTQGVTGSITFDGSNSTVEVNIGLDTYSGNTPRTQAEWDLIKLYLQANSPVVITVTSSSILSVTFTKTSAGTNSYTQPVTLVAEDALTKVNDLYAIVLAQHKRDISNMASPVSGAKSVKYSSGVYSETSKFIDAMNGFLEASAVSMGANDAIQFTRKLESLSKIRVFSTQYYPSVTLFCSSTSNSLATIGYWSTPAVQPGWNEFPIFPFSSGDGFPCLNMRLATTTGAAFTFKAIEAYLWI
jgi:hypothetical protein